LRRDLDEIQIERLGPVQRVAGVHHPDLLPVVPNQANLCRSDPVVDPRIC
jgi:hypothetical protein